MTSKIMVYMLADNPVGEKVFIKTLVHSGGTEESEAWIAAEKLATSRSYTVYGSFDERSPIAFAAIDDSHCLELIE
jgi:hypothetical protein